MQWGAWAGTGMAVTHNLLPRIIKSGEWRLHILLASSIDLTEQQEALHREAAALVTFPTLQVS